MEGYVAKKRRHLAAQTGLGLSVGTAIDPLARSISASSPQSLFSWNGFLLHRQSFARVRPLPDFGCSARTTDSDERERRGRKGGEDRAPLSSTTNA